MKKIVSTLAIICPFFLFAQIGLKAGLNFANVTNASSINNSSRSGFMAGVFLAPSHKSIISSVTELLYSRQGYNFQTGSKSGNVNLDYIILPQLMGINITRFVQVQIGAQVAYLINAKADSSNNNNGIPGPYGSVLNYYNKFDYGFAAGVEIHPFMGLLVGARYNIGLSKIYKDIQTGQTPSFSVSDAKNNVVQIFAGWRFGGQ
ncbi:MAG: PorT family protein [Bacteroidota bacterium]|nr:PorT family protein [Bacteroidota bacterium]